jgi:DNA-binding CsgD family transcriptional regulator
LWRAAALVIMRAVKQSSARSHRRAHAAAVRACEAALAPAEVSATLADAFAAVADLRGVCFHLADPASGVPIASTRTGAPPGDFERSLEYEYRRPDVARWVDVAQRRQPVAALSRETAGTPTSSARFREMLEPEGCVDELRIAFADAFGTWGYLTAFSAQRFCDDDLALATALVPHVTVALRRQRAARAGSVAAEDDRPAVVVVSGSGEVVAADQRASARLAAIGPCPGEIPGVVAVLAGRARSADSAPATARTADQQGRWWLLDASPLDGGTVAIVIQPAPDTALLDGLLRAYGLSRREREVTTHAVAGRSTKAIAAALHLSPWTVQDHLKNVFDKVGVRSRGDLSSLIVSSAQRSAATPYLRSP